MMSPIFCIVVCKLHPVWLVQEVCALRKLAESEDLESSFEQQPSFSLNSSRLAEACGPGLN